MPGKVATNSIESPQVNKLARLTQIPPLLFVGATPRLPAVQHRRIPGAPKLATYSASRT